MLKIIEQYDNCHSPVFIHFLFSQIQKNSVTDIRCLTAEHLVELYL